MRTSPALVSTYLTINSRLPTFPGSTSRRTPVTLMSVWAWVMPRKQHFLALTSVVGAGVGVWGWLGHALFPSSGTNGAFVLLLGLSAIMPLGVALLGLLPPGRLRRRTA